MRIDTILWDVDGTLLDFDTAETLSVRECTGRYGAEVSDEQLAEYKRINQQFWERLEQGEMTRRELGPRRFKNFLEYLGRGDIDAEGLDKEYQEALSRKGILTAGAQEICLLLKEKGCRQYVVTNGTALVQHRRLHLSGLDQYMEDIFISEELGHAKPEKAFFDLCAKRIPDYAPERTMIIGDSLTSDMKGGNRAGIRCCWFNPAGAAPAGEVRIDCEIGSLAEAAGCLE